MITFANKISRVVLFCAAGTVFGFFITGIACAQINIPKFGRDLTVGSKGADVRDLQMFLNASGFSVANSGPGSAGKETLLFGNATKAALAKFQAAHGILASGYFGSKTRGYLVSMAKPANVSSSDSDSVSGVLNSRIEELQRQLNALLSLSSSQPQPADAIAPDITAIDISNAGNGQFVGTGTTIAINFSEPIDPQSVNAGLAAGGSVARVSYSRAGGVNVTASGEVIVNGIANFSVGSVQNTGQFNVNLALDSSGKILTVTLAGNNNIRILAANLSKADQIGGTVRDLTGNVMKSAGQAIAPGGEFSGNSGSSLIDAINVSNGGKNGYIDDGDTIAITFDRPIEPKSINDNLIRGGSVSLVQSSQAGGVNVTASGEVIVNGIANFNIGSVNNSGGFGTKLSLNATGKILTVSLVDGVDIRITSENFGAANQAGGVIKAENGQTLAFSSGVVVPTGSFGGSGINTGSDPHISAIKISNGGTSGYIDNGDAIAVTFSQAVDPKSINANLGNGVTVPSISSTQTGGVSVSSLGQVAIVGIADFNAGAVDSSGNFMVKMSLDSTGRILTLMLTSGNKIAVANENFGPADQIGGTVRDNNGNTMAAFASVITPGGTFGGQINAGGETAPPYISAINVANGGGDGYIDDGDSITVTFSEAINPKSINNNLSAGDYIIGVLPTNTGGVTISQSGKVTVSGIADFDMGSVDNSTAFTVMLALDNTGRFLTITLVDGNDAKITDESFGAADQIGNLIKDSSGNKMLSQSAIIVPAGTFGGEY